MIRRLQIQDFFVFFFAAFCFALPFSVYVISVSMFGMAACSIFEDHATGIRLNRSWPQSMKRLWENQAGIYSIAFYLLIALSILWSTENAFWIHHLRLLAPMVVIPLVFAVHGRLKIVHLRWVIGLSILSMVIQLTIVLVRYYADFEVINHNILKGKPIPTPISHIRFSLILAGDLLVLIFLFLERRWTKYRWEAWLYAALMIYFFIGLHILSVKSGLAGFYLGLIALAVIYLFSHKKLHWLYWIMPSLFGLFFFMVFLTPSLYNKYLHFIWQMGEWTRGKYHWYSDIERWQSISFGWEIITRHPLFGTGIGDLPGAMASVYQEKIQSTEVKYPHNQFVFTWAAAGLPALFSLMMMMYHSLLKNFFQRNILTAALGVMIWFSLMVEHGLETAAGIGIFQWMLVLQNELRGSKSET
ncbi:MAG: O-antigen ligase family protein [Saprospiraceae bacterium]